MNNVTSSLQEILQDLLIYFSLSFYSTNQTFDYVMRRCGILGHIQCSNFVTLHYIALQHIKITLCMLRTKSTMKLLHNVMQ